MNLKDKTQQLLKLRAKIDEADKKYEEKIGPIKAKKEELQAEIIAELKASEQFSARFDNATISRAVRKTMQIVDEKMLVEHLKSEGLTDYITERPNELFKGISSEAVKQGKIFPGTEIRETEYLSVTKSDKEERRKVNIE